MRFYGISKEEMSHLRDGMSILGRVMDVEEFNPYLYVLVNNGETLEAAREVIQGDRPSQVAVAISISADTLDYLMGSGIYLETEEFAYVAGEGNGSRLAELNKKCKLFMNEITQIAVSSDSAWVGEFLDSNSTQQAPAPSVERSEPIQASGPKPDYDPSQLEFHPQSPGAEVVRTPQVEMSSVPKTASVPGFERVLIGDEPLSELKVTQLIEIGDYIEDHQRGKGRYLHAEVEGREWLIYSEDPELGRQNLARVIRNKYSLPSDPEVNILTAPEVEAVMEGVVEEQL